MAIKLDPSGENFLLTKDAQSLLLFPDDVLALLNAASRLRQSIMASQHPGKLIATPVARLRAMWDAWRKIFSWSSNFHKAVTRNLRCRPSIHKHWLG
jgi:hypothetical protein